MFWKSSSVSCQFLMDPFTNPDTMMKPSTRTLTHVKTLLTMADSFTPRVRSPAKARQQKLSQCEPHTRHVLLGWGRGRGREGDLGRIQAASDLRGGNGAEFILILEAGIKITKVCGGAEQSHQGWPSRSPLDSRRRARGTSRGSDVPANGPREQGPPSSRTSIPQSHPRGQDFISSKRHFARILGRVRVSQKRSHALTARGR